MRAEKRKLKVMRRLSEDESVCSVSDVEESQQEDFNQPEEKIEQTDDIDDEIEAMTVISLIDVPTLKVKETGEEDR